jgi:hypothetical protein
VGFFKHPLSLLRLALFLQDALRTVKRIERPLVVVVRRIRKSHPTFRRICPTNDAFLPGLPGQHTHCFVVNKTKFFNRIGTTVLKCIVFCVCVSRRYLKGPSPDGDKGLALVVGVTGKPQSDDTVGG